MFFELTDCSEATVPLEDTETACMLVTALSVDKEVCAKDNNMYTSYIMHNLNVMHWDDSIAW